MRIRDDRSYLQRENKNIFPGEIYRQVVLEPLFVDARNELFESLMKIHQAHGVMLAEEKIISEEDIGMIFKVLGDLEKEINWHEVQYDPRFEDLFFHLENEIIGRVGEKIAGQLHTGRSRNDIDATLFRMVLREKLLALADQLLDFRQAILRLAEENVNTLVLGYTHTQPAQPTTLAHYLLGVLNFLERDFQRLQEFYTRLNMSPMGAGALTTTSFRINRESVARYLGFDQVLENSYDCVGGSDHLVEGSGLLVVMMTSLSRLLYDFLLYVMEEFNYLRLGDAYVQISSIMPQKRNPVSLEHSRALATGILGQAQIIPTMLTNTPYGDIVDKEQELQRHLWQAWDRAIELYKLLTVIFNGVEVNRERLIQRTRESFAVVTQLADSLVQYTDLSFRSAHRIVSQLVKEALIKGIKVWEIDGQMVNRISEAVIGQSLEFTDEMVTEALDPVKFVKIRTRPGGPAPQVVTQQLQNSKSMLANDENWLSGKWRQVEKSEKILDARVEELIRGNIMV